jgi:hypothetical protein
VSSRSSAALRLRNSPDVGALPGDGRCHCAGGGLRGDRLFAVSGEPARAQVIAERMAFLRRSLIHAGASLAC